MYYIQFNAENPNTRQVQPYYANIRSLPGFEDSPPQMYNAESRHTATRFDSKDAARDALEVQRQQGRAGHFTIVDENDRFVSTESI